MKGTSINKMADYNADYWLSQLSCEGFTQICVARGIVSWGSEDGAARELQLWYSEILNKHRIYTRKTTGGCCAVCKVINVLLCTSKSALTKSKRS